MAPRHDPPESRLDLWEVVDLLGGFAVVALPLFLLAVPAVALLLYVIVPLTIVGLVVALVVLPPLAAARAIAARRRRTRRPRRPARSGDAARQAVVGTITGRPAA